MLRDFEIPSPAHPMTVSVYLDYHQKATFLFVINESPVRAGEFRATRWEWKKRGRLVGSRKKGPRAEHFDGFFDNKRLSKILRGAGGSDGEKEERKTLTRNSPAARLAF